MMCSPLSMRSRAIEITADIIIIIIIIFSVYYRGARVDSSVTVLFSVCYREAHDHSSVTVLSSVCYRPCRLSGGSWTSSALHCSDNEVWWGKKTPFELGDAPVKFTMANDRQAWTYQRRVSAATKRSKKLPRAREQLDSKMLRKIDAVSR